ncbi:MAG TPA: hypothetical protein VFI31_08060 [Pirellulales bacterium]|nr:hypothetical protein [Pirellulales bacterium]
MAAQHHKPIQEIVLAELVGRESAARLQKWLAEQQGDEPFGVPSRFGIGTLLVVTAAYALLLTLLRSLLDWDPRAIVWFVVFVSLVGAGQMLLFGSRRPRQASLITGAIALPAIVIMTFIFHGDGRSPPEARRVPFALHCCLAPRQVIWPAAWWPASFSSWTPCNAA